jgi:hypothetical protein
MSNQAWVEPFLITGEDGPALVSSSVATSILPLSRKFTLASYFFDGIGKTLRIRAAGKISTKASAPGTLTLDIRFGSVVVFNGGTSATLAVSATNLTWVMEAYLTCRAIGASTSANVIGIGKLETAALSATTPIMLLPVSAPAAGTGFDSTTAQTVDLFAAFSVSDAANSITCQQFSIEAMN